MHAMQAVHSTERIFISLSTGKDAGQAWAHRAQSTQASGSRRILSGLTNEARPMSAP